MAPRTPIRSGSGDGDTDPFGFGDSINAFDALPHDPPTSAVDHASLRDVATFIRDRGAATGRTVRSECYTGKARDLYRSNTEWYDTLIRPYLPFVEGIRAPAEPGQKWEFDADSDGDRPAPVTTVLEEEFVNDAVDALPDDVLPEPDGVSAHLQHRNRTAVKRAYCDLAERGTAGRGTLRDHYVPSSVGREYGLYEDVSRWFRIVGAPALRRCPGVSAPSTVGGTWVFTGVGTNPE